MAQRVDRDFLAAALRFWAEDQPDPDVAIADDAMAYVTVKEAKAAALAHRRCLRQAWRRLSGEDLEVGYGTDRIDDHFVFGLFAPTRRLAGSSQLLSVSELARLRVEVARRGRDRGRSDVVTRELEAAKRERAQMTAAVLDRAGVVYGD